MKITTYSVGALAFIAFASASPTRPRPTPKPLATATATSDDEAFPTIQAHVNRDSEAAWSRPVEPPVPTGDADIHQTIAVLPRENLHKTHKKHKATITSPTEKPLETTTVTFGTTIFASEQTDSWGDLTGDISTTYYLKFTDELPWTSTKTITHTYTHVTPIEATALLQARVPRTTAPTSTQPDLGDEATFEFISFSKTSWITSLTTQVQIIRWPPKTRGPWPHFDHFHLTTSTKSAKTRKHHKHSSSPTNKASPQPTDNTKPAKHTKHHHKSTPERTTEATPSSSSYVDYFEWSKTHVFEPEITASLAKKDITSIRPTTAIDRGVDTLKWPEESEADEREWWSVTYMKSPETSVTATPSTFLKRPFFSKSKVSSLTETPFNFVKRPFFSKSHVSIVTATPSTFFKRPLSPKSNVQRLAEILEPSSSYVDSFEWSKTHTEPETSATETPTLSKRAIDSHKSESSLSSDIATTSTLPYVDSFEWSKTHEFESETSTTPPPATLSKRATLSTRSPITDAKQHGPTLRPHPSPTASFEEIYESWDDDDDLFERLD